MQSILCLSCRVQYHCIPCQCIDENSLNQMKCVDAEEYEQGCWRDLLLITSSSFSPLYFPRWLVHDCDTYHDIDLNPLCLWCHALGKFQWSMWTTSCLTSLNSVGLSWYCRYDLLWDLRSILLFSLFVLFVLMDPDVEVARAWHVSPTTDRHVRRRRHLWCRRHHIWLDICQTDVTSWAY